MNQNHYGIRAIWRVEPTSPAVLGERFLAALEAISKTVPTVGEWELGEPPYRAEYITISEARAKLIDWVESNAATMDGAPDPKSGFRLIADNSGKVSPENVGLTASLGGRLGDSIRFRVGFPHVPSDPETVTYPLFLAAFMAIITQWSCVWANAYLHVPRPYEIVSVGSPPIVGKRTRASNLSLAPGIPPHPDSSYHRPWLSYLCAPLTKGLVPPVGVPCERTVDGGLVMIAAEERLDPTNPEHMRRSRAMAETMIGRAGDPPRRGYWPIDEEWPPTEEARRRRGPPAP